MSCPCCNVHDDDIFDDEDLDNEHWHNTNVSDNNHPIKENSQDGTN